MLIESEGLESSCAGHFARHPSPESSGSYPRRSRASRSSVRFSGASVGVWYTSYAYLSWVLGMPLRLDAAAFGVLAGALLNPRLDALARVADVLTDLESGRSVAADAPVADGPYRDAEK